MNKHSPLSLLPLYNLFSAIFWAYILFVILNTYPRVGQPQFFHQTKNLVTYIQCGAVIEIVNSLLGIVRAPLLTTVAQVSSRLLIVLGIFQVLPETPIAQSSPYVILLFAWSITEVVRYLFYYTNLVFKNGAPKLIILLRYNLFWILYPMGVCSELLMIYSSLPLAESIYGIYYKYTLVFGMLTYVPGFPVLFFHMISQRKKVMKMLNKKMDSINKKN